MKTYTRVRCEWIGEHYEMVDSDSYEYTGPVAQCLPAAVIAALISAGVAGTGMGLQASGALTPDTPKAPGVTTPPGPSKSQLQAAIAPQAATIESMTGGSVSPDYLSTVAPLLAGAGGQTNTNSAMQSIIQQIFGAGGGSTGGGTPTVGAGGTSAGFAPTGLPTNLASLASSPGLSDFLQKLGSSGIS